MKALKFVCPACKGDLQPRTEDFLCKGCVHQYPIVMGIPDFRIFPDPYISIDDDYRKGRALAEHYDKMSFAQLVDRYWQMTPGVRKELVREYVSTAIHKDDRSQSTWEKLEQFCESDTPEGLLEVGCGTAGFLAAAGPSCSWAVGVDIAFRWLVIAKKRLKESGVNNVSLVCGCAEYLPFRDETFDRVVAEDVLDHVRSQESFMQEGARVLKGHTGGFYLSSPNRYSLGPDPHVWVWGVSMLPAGWRDRYMLWRKGIPYGPIRPVSYFRLLKLLRSAGLHKYRVILRELQGPEYGDLSRWHRTQASIYKLVWRLPVVRNALRFVGPTLQVLCRKVQ